MSSARKTNTSSHDELEKQRIIAREKAKTVKERKEEQKQAEMKVKDHSQNKIRGAAKKQARRKFWMEYIYYFIAAGVAAVLVGVYYFNVNTIATEGSPKFIPVIEESYINNHNEGDSEYSLGENQLFQGVSLEEARKMFNNHITQKSPLVKCPVDKEKTELPANYNFRSKFPDCEKSIVDQGICSSSWAIAATGIFTDRLCAMGNNDESYRASTQQVLTCDKKASQGCEKGYIMHTFEYGRVKGFVDQECMKYKPYDISVDCNYSELNKCHSKEFVSDYCAFEGVNAIKREILKNGPVASVFPAYRDFLIYKDGVYQPSSDVTKIEGNQAVKIIGWDTDAKNEYWIIENSFGDDWGQHGLAWIKIGIQDSQLDKVAVAVYPKVDENSSTEETSTN